MICLFIDSDRERLIRNFKYFGQKDDMIFVAIDSAEKTGRFQNLANVVIIYYSTDIEMDDLIKNFNCCGTKNYIVCNEMNADNKMLSYFIDADILTGDYETEKLYSYLCSEREMLTAPTVDYNLKTAKMFKMLCVPLHLQGVGYLKEAVELCCVNKEMLDGITKCLYPFLAVKYSTNPAAVERSIRTAIERIWADNSDFMTHKLLLNDGKRPTNKAFIHICVKYIRDNL